MWNSYVMRYVEITEGMTNVDFDTYEMLFGMPELTKFHVMLDGITQKEAENALVELSEGYTIEENELLRQRKSNVQSEAKIKYEGNPVRKILKAGE